MGALRRLHQTTDGRLLTGKAESAVPVAEDGRRRWFYRAVLSVRVYRVSLARTLGAVLGMEEGERERERAVGAQLTLQTTVPHLRHSATMSRAQLPALPL